jgi:hypothetical protein
MSDVRYEIKLRYLLSDLKHWLKNPGRFVSTNTHNLVTLWFRQVLILVDPVDDEDVEEIFHELILQTSDNVRSKEM